MDAAEWLEQHADAKDKAARALGYSRAELLEKFATDISFAKSYAASLYKISNSENAPKDVQEQILDASNMIASGIDKVKNRGPFLQRTLASFQGLSAFDDFKLVLRGAVPHAPTEEDRQALLGMNEVIEKAEQGILRLESGGSTIACLIGCVICEAACLVCCTILYLEK